MSDKSELVGKVTGVFITALLQFAVNLAIIKLGWNGVLTHIFPSLPQISWFQALILLWICEALFKQRTVKVVQ